MRLRAIVGNPSSESDSDCSSCTVASLGAASRGVSEAKAFDWADRLSEPLIPRRARCVLFAAGPMNTLLCVTVAEDGVRDIVGALLRATGVPESVTGSEGTARVELPGRAENVVVSGEVPPRWEP